MPTAFVLPSVYNSSPISMMLLWRMRQSSSIIASRIGGSTCASSLFANVFTST